MQKQRYYFCFRYNKCSVPSCCAVENIDLNLQFFSFPLNRLTSKLWLEKCNLPNDVAYSKLRICQDHFVISDFDVQHETRILKQAAIPSKKLDGPELMIKDIKKLKGVLVQQVRENIEIKSKIDQLDQTVNSLNGKIDVCNTRIKRRKRVTNSIKQKLKKLTVGVNRNNLLSKVFSNAQINVLSGEDKVIWSDDDLAMAFSLRQLSSKECYMYLKNTLNIPLPSLSCVQRWAASK